MDDTGFGYVSEDGTVVYYESTEDAVTAVWSEMRADKDRTGGFARPGSLLGGNIQFAGMTLRDHYAGLAMAAIIGKTPLMELPVGETDFHIKSARGAYLYADAMLAARK